MAMKPLDLETLSELDGSKVAIALNTMIRQAVMDCQDRSNLKKARKVSMTISIMPQPDQKGVCDEVKFGIAFKTNLPNFQTLEYSAGLKANGAAVVSEASPYKFDQSMIFDEDE